METEEDFFEEGLTDEEISRIKKVNIDLTTQPCAICLNNFGSGILKIGISVIGYKQSK